ncbi:hypothetical protein [Nocardia niwae]|uniref:hypothetical protein n=1 Tax=Nocardia niwae TaxID=626084 RepID=UPI0007A39F91|nr:hypothetical protein [Nocardia niwae]
MTASITHPHWLHDLAAHALHWAHAHHDETVRRREGIGAYAVTSPEPLASEWPTSPPPRYIQARGIGLRELPYRSRSHAARIVGFNY